MNEIKPKSNRGGARAGAGRKSKESKPAGCANCQTLADEVAQLKKRLAVANEEIVRMVSEGERQTTPRSNPLRVAEWQGEPCIHGGYVGRCGKIGCRPK